MSTLERERDVYDPIADSYAASYTEPHPDGFNYNRDLVIPRLLEVVGPVDDLSVLDAGCGEGVVSRRLERAAKVVGIDLSPRFIGYARERDVSQRIRYELHDLSQPLPQYHHTFDLIVSNLVLNDVAAYEGFIATLGGVLKPSGRLVLSMNNPYSAVLREKVESYFDSDSAVLYNFGPVHYYHRTMEEYLTAFSRAGLLLQCLYDVRMPEKLVAQLPEANHAFPWYPFYHRFPFMIILDLVKPPVT